MSRSWTVSHFLDGSVFRPLVDGKGGRKERVWRRLEAA